MGRFFAPAQSHKVLLLESLGFLSRGLSHMYLGQRGTTKLASKGGVDVPANYKHLGRKESQHDGGD